MIFEQKQKKNLLLASLYADAFALGPHWIYDQSVIAHNFGDIRHLTAPLPDSYHQTKVKGDFTHYGDQTFFLLQQLIKLNGFDLAKVKQEWFRYMKNYSGYLDNASRKTIENIEADMTDPVGAPSHDLSAAGRIAPFLYFYDETAPLLNAIEQQTRMTHNNGGVVEAAIYFTHVCLMILQGSTVSDAVARALDMVTDNEIKTLINRGIQAADKESIDALSEFRTSCSYNHSLPGTVQIILHHSDNLLDAFNVNVMAGGDSAARGLLIGAVLGAALDLDTSLFSDMNQYHEIELLINPQ